ncbi:MAG: L,D-transpeptidase [Patescibacteria group bacterium]|nr:L,D-transpeptidase [Patescibacteria group bacterium]
MRKLILTIGIIALAVVVYFAYLINSMVWIELVFYNLAPNLYENDSESPFLVSLNYSSLFHSAYEMLHEQGDLSDYIIVIDVSEQREYVFDNEGSLYKRYKISTGSSMVLVEEDDEESTNEESTSEESEEESELEYEDRSMGVSVWKVRYKTEHDASSYYGPRIMMLDRYIDGHWVQTDVALHGTNRPDLLGTPWSLGCVYHNNADIIDLYDLIDIGTFVVAIE